MNRKSVVATLLAVAVSFIIAFGNAPVNAQFSGVNPAYVPGFFALAGNQTNFQPAVTTGAAGTVTNPASNFLMQIDGGPIFCGGGEDNITESNVTLAASTTFLVVYNCGNNTVYAKTAVTGPGSSTTSTGIPATILAAIPGVEVALATVVCNATACGNGGNGSITDSRSAANFPNGKQLSKIAFASLNASAPDGAMVLCTSCTVLTTGSATCTSGAGNVLAVRVTGAWRCY